jgi:hypothetical protein
MYGRATPTIVVPTTPINVGMTTAAPTNQGLIALRLSESKGSVALLIIGSRWWTRHPP